MLTSTIIPLLTIASIAQAFPLDSPSSPRSSSFLSPRLAGQSVNGALRWDGVEGLGGSGGDATPGIKALDSGAPSAGGQEPGSSGSGAVAYQMFTGDGKSWPTRDSWVQSFSAQFTANEAVMKISCKQFDKDNNSEEEINDIKEGILIVAKETGVDPRMILAIIMQESKGCVRVPTTTSPGPDGHSNPGLMQDHDGTFSCTESPCPTEKIQGMIREGTAGTGKGEGIAELINNAVTSGATGTSLPYIVAARVYNTGPSYQVGQDLGAPQFGTSCYASDILNRLMGWSESDSPCKLPNPQ